MPLFRRLATIAAAAEAARRYARKNPDQAARYLDQAASFVDKQTKGRYSGQIDGVARRAKSVAGIPTTPGTVPGSHAAGPTPGATSSNGNGPVQDRGFGDAGYGETPPRGPQPGQTYPGTPTQ